MKQIPYLKEGSLESQLGRFVDAQMYFVIDPEMAAQVFRGMIEGTNNFPALYSPLKTAGDLQPLKDEIVATFLSRYQA